MKIKLSKIAEAAQVLRKLDTMVLPIIVTFQIEKVLGRLIEESDIIEKARVALFKKYGIEDKEKKTTTIPPDKMEAAEKEFNELLEQEIKIEVWQIPISLLKNMEIPANDLRKIKMFLIDDVTKPNK